jgi:hypothetical protein
LRSNNARTVTVWETLSFFLEVLGLVGIGRWGWTVGDGGVGGGALAIVFIAAAGAAWGIFRARNFVPRGGDPTVAIPGALRLALELGFYALATIGFWISGWTIAAIGLGAGTIVVYTAMRERVMGLLRQP